MLQCDLDDSCTCDFDDDDCDEGLCVRQQEGEGGTTDDITALLVDCEYLYGDRAALDNPASSPTNVAWVEADGGDRSPFYDKCELYVMCDLVTDSLGRDDYSIACGKCADGHFPAIDTRFNQQEASKALCSETNQFPTYCYPLDVNALDNLDYDEYCPNNNPYQINQCIIWHENQWKTTVREYGGGSVVNPFALEGCARTTLCSFDEDDMTNDKYYLQCIECNQHWVPEFISKVQLSDYDDYNGTNVIDISQIFNGDACADRAEVPQGMILNRCVQGPTSAPSAPPTNMPSGERPATPAPTCIPGTDGCDLGNDKDNNAADTAGFAAIMENPAILGGIGGGVMVLAAVIFFLNKKGVIKRDRYDTGDSDSDSSDSDRDRDSSGFEMTNPMKKTGKRNSKRPSKRRSSVKKSKGRGAKKTAGNNDWTTKKDPNSGKTFYYNTRTKAVSWSKPDDGSSSSGSESESESGSSSGSSSSDESVVKKKKGGKKAIPSGGPKGAAPGPPVGVWDTFQDPESGREYFVHEKTGETTWVKPTSGIK